MNWVSENRIILATLALVVIVFGAIILKPKNSEANNIRTSSLDYTQINSSSHMTKGDQNAKGTVIQYSDFLCPSCSLLSIQTMPKIEQKYINTGKVKFEFRPMAFIAEGSKIAGMGAYCAVDQNKFWEYHDNVYKYSANKIFNEKMDPTKDVILTNDIVKSIANQSGLNSDNFNYCLDSGKHLSDITSSTEDANKNGIKSTPTVLVNGKTINGVPSYESIDSLLKATL